MPAPRGNGSYSDHAIRRIPVTLTFFGCLSVVGPFPTPTNVRSQAENRIEPPQIAQQINLVRTFRTQYRTNCIDFTIFHRNFCAKTTFLNLP